MASLRVWAALVSPRRSGPHSVSCVHAHACAATNRSTGEAHAVDVGTVFSREPHSPCRSLTADIGYSGKLVSFSVTRSSTHLPDLLQQTPGLYIGTRRILGAALLGESLLSRNRRFGSRCYPCDGSHTCGGWRGVGPLCSPSNSSGSIDRASSLVACPHQAASVTGDALLTGAKAFSSVAHPRLPLATDVPNAL